jgi:hypothetical protein
MLSWIPFSLTAVMALIGIAATLRHLHAVLAEYQAHYNAARPHQDIAHVPDDERDGRRATVTDRASRLWSASLRR